MTTALPDPTPILVNGKELPADRRRVTIGRDTESGVRYSDERVSRRHAVLEAGEDGWVLRDLGSRNGTFRDGVRITEVTVDGRLHLRLGHPLEGALLELAPADAARAEAEAAGEEPPPVQRPAAPTGRVRIGRGAENDIRVEGDLRASRYHAELRPAPGGGYELVDLGSHNGTFVNGERIRSAVLANGDLAGIGNQLYAFRHGALEAVAAEEAGSLRVADLCVEVDGGKRILEDVSLSLAPSSLMAVVGPSGSGKTTLLNALTEFRPADSGSVYIGDRDLYDSYEELRFQMGYVPQEDILHPQLTVRRALDFAAELRFPPDVGEDERRQRVGEVIVELGLSERSEIRIEKLSGGQRKRVSVGLELLTKPLLLFLDEPTSGLDPGNERELMELLHELARGGRTVIVVTHSTQSLDLCDRVVFLAPGGKTAYFGPPVEALEYFSDHIEERSYAELFTLLDRSRDIDWKAAFEQDDRWQRYVGAPSAAAERSARRAKPLPPRVRHSWLRQLSVLSRRNAALIVSDRRTLLLLILQAPLLGLLFSQVAQYDAFATSNGVNGAVFVWLMVIGATWVGVSNSIRELVKEYPVYRRERSVGLGIGPYLASKALVYGAITVAEAVLLLLIGVGISGVDIPPTDPSGLLPYMGADPERFAEGAAVSSLWVELLVAMGLAGLSSLALGFFVSAVVRTSDQALVLLPLILALQVVVSIPDPFLRQPPLTQIGAVTSTYWGVEATGSTMSMNELRALTDYVLSETRRAANRGISPDALATALGLTPDALEKGLTKQAQEDGDPRWKHQGGTWAGNVAALLGLAAFSLAAALLALRLRDPKILAEGARPKRRRKVRQLREAAAALR